MIKNTSSLQVFIKIDINFLKCFNNYIPIHIIPNFLNEENIDVVTDEICNVKNFEKSDTETETCKPIKELKYPQDFQYGGNFALD